MILEIGTVVEHLFTDVVMRGTVSGARALRGRPKSRPPIRVLLTSGYAENSIIHNGEFDPVVDFFSKPYDRERLAMTVRRQEHRRPRTNRNPRVGSFERPLPAET